DRKSTRLNSSHVAISYAVFCLKKESRTGRAGRAAPRRVRQRPRPGTARCAVPAPRPPSPPTPLRAQDSPVWPSSFFFLMIRRPPRSTPFPYTTPFRSRSRLAQRYSRLRPSAVWSATAASTGRSEEHTSELQSRPHLVCRLLLEKKK